MSTGIREEADRGVLGALARRLVLELRHAARLAEAGDRAEHPRELGVRGTCDCTNSVERFEVDARARYWAAVPSRRAARRVLLHGDRVQVDDA